MFENREQSALQVWGQQLLPSGTCTPVGTPGDIAPVQWGVTLWRRREAGGDQRALAAPCHTMPYQSRAQRIPGIGSANQVQVYPLQTGVLETKRCPQDPQALPQDWGDRAWVQDSVVMTQDGALLEEESEGGAWGASGPSDGKGLARRTGGTIESTL